jgi:GT2 family glycosyltransferase
MVTYNTLHRECLQSVAAAMASCPRRVAFVIVDNASTRFDVQELVDATVPGAVVIRRTSNEGFGRSCNLGAAAVRARHYFFLNPDTRLHSYEVLLRLMDVLEGEAAIGIAAPRVHYLDGTLQETCRRFPKWYMPFIRRTAMGAKRWAQRQEAHFLMRDIAHDHMRPVDWVQGSAFMVRADAWERVGGFDERYFLYYEDVDVCRSMWAQGLAVYYVPDVVVAHAYQQASGKRHGSLWRTAWKNPAARAHVVSWLQYTWKWLGE